MKTHCGLILLLLLSAAGWAGNMVYYQPHNLSDTLYQSSGNGSLWDRFVWDNFTLSTDQDIIAVTWRGGYIYGTADPFGPVLDFSISFWHDKLGTPDLLAGAFMTYAYGSSIGNAGETPIGMFGGITMYDYQWTLPAPLPLAAGTKYWIRIEANQAGIPDWGLAAGSNGNNLHFENFSETSYNFFAGDSGFALIADVADLNFDGIVNFVDFLILSWFWQDNTCGTDNAWCSGCDFDQNGVVDIMDLSKLAKDWLLEAPVF